jgi:hypothetical protein
MIAMRLVAIALCVVPVALAACESSDRSATDASQPVDAAYPDTPWDDRAVPFTLAGTTPIGTLDFVRYRSAGFLDGFCPSGVYLYLKSNQEVFSRLPELQIMIPLDPFATPAPAGNITASARLVSDHGDTTADAATDEVSFDLSRAEIVSSQPNTLGVAGRLSIASGGWSFDFTIDEVLVQNTCI